MKNILLIFYNFMSVAYAIQSNVLVLGSDVNCVKCFS